MHKFYQKWRSQKTTLNHCLRWTQFYLKYLISQMLLSFSLNIHLQNGRESLGDSIYRNITVEFFDPDQFLSTMDLSSEHKILDLKDRIEASIVIWKRKMNQKDGKSAWGSAVSLEKRELFEERAETILLILKHRFPGTPQSALDISKIQYNRVQNMFFWKVLCLKSWGGWNPRTVLFVFALFSNCTLFCKF